MKNLSRPQGHKRRIASRFHSHFSLAGR